MPVRGFLFERAPAQRAETVELRASVIVRDAPLRVHPAANLETMERRIERAFHDAQHVVGRTLNGGHDAVAMHLAATEHFENQHVERARHQLAGFLCSHKRFRDDSAARRPVKEAVGALALPASRAGSGIAATSSAVAGGWLKQVADGIAVLKTRDRRAEGLTRCVFSGLVHSAKTEQAACVCVRMSGLPRAAFLTGSRAYSAPGSCRTPRGTLGLAAIQRQHWLDPRCPPRGEKRCQYADGDEHDCAATV